MTDRSISPNGSSRRAKTREAINAAGLRLFARHPVDAIAIDQIVAAADVSKGSFYNHFADRGALVEAIVDDIRVGIQTEVARANTDVADPARCVARGLCVFYRFAVAEPERAAVLVQIQGGKLSLASAFNAHLVAYIAAGLSAARFAVPTVEAGVLFAHGVGQVGLLRIGQEPSAAMATVLAQQLCALVLRGLGLDRLEAEGIAAQAADELVRGGSDPGAVRPLSET